MNSEARTFLVGGALGGIVLMSLDSASKSSADLVLWLPMMLGIVSGTVATGLKSRGGWGFVLAKHLAILSAAYSLSAMFILPNDLS